MPLLAGKPVLLRKTPGSSCQSFEETLSMLRNHGFLTLRPFAPGAFFPITLDFLLLTKYTCPKRRPHLELSRLRLQHTVDFILGEAHDEEFALNLLGREALLAGGERELQHLPLFLALPALFLQLFHLLPDALPSSPDRFPRRRDFLQLFHDARPGDPDRFLRLRDSPQPFDKLLPGLPDPGEQVPRLFFGAVGLPGGVDQLMDVFPEVVELVPGGLLRPVLHLLEHLRGGPDMLLDMRMDALPASHVLDLGERVAMMDGELLMQEPFEGRGELLDVPRGGNPGEMAPVGHRPLFHALSLEGRVFKDSHPGKYL